MIINDEDKIQLAFNELNNGLNFTIEQGFNDEILKRAVYQNIITIEEYNATMKNYTKVVSLRAYNDIKQGLGLPDVTFSRLKKGVKLGFISEEQEKEAITSYHIIQAKRAYNNLMKGIDFGFNFERLDKGVELGVISFEEKEQATSTYKSITK